MKKRTMRNIVFGIKVSAICGATVFASAGIRETIESAEKDTRVVATQTAAIIEENEVPELWTPYEVSETEAETEETSQTLIYSMDWDIEESYLLAKIAMAEAEGEGTEGKALVMLVVLNRVWSDKFPGTISEVIYQEDQFSPVANGRFDRVEPDEDCYKALDMIQIDKWDESNGALYFESESASGWHRRNLKFLFQHGKHYFYTDKE